MEKHSISGDNRGKMYKKREDAEKQGTAIEAQGYKKKPKSKR